MKLISSLLLGIFLALSSSTSYAETSKQALPPKTVRISTGEWPPYISENLENNGVLSQVTKEAFGLEGITVEFGFFPWERAAHLSRSGDWDGTIAFVRLAEREKFYFFSDTIYNGQYAFYHLKSEPLKWNDFADLSKLKIATTIGFGGMGEGFINAEKNGTIKVLRVKSDDQSFQMLMANRVDAVPSDIEVGSVRTKNLFGAKMDQLTYTAEHTVPAEYHLVISKKLSYGPVLVEKFNQGLAQLRKSGRYDEILRAWYDKPIYRDSIPVDYLKSKLQLKRKTH